MLFSISNFFHFLRLFHSSKVTFIISKSLIGLKSRNSTTVYSLINFPISSLSKNLPFSKTILFILLSSINFIIFSKPISRVTTSSKISVFSFQIDLYSPIFFNSIRNSFSFILSPTFILSRSSINFFEKSTLFL